jgi:hypothetical protein
VLFGRIGRFLTRFAAVIRSGWIGLAVVFPFASFGSPL